MKNNTISADTLHTIIADEETQKQPTFITVKQAAEDPCLPFSESSLRYHIFNSKTNGLEPCLRRIGKKIVIIRELLIDWVMNENTIS
jgi:hypothetical protein